MTITHIYDPAQYVLVPREPTPEMCAAANRVIQNEGAHRPGRTFRRIQAAIAAAPPPPAPPTDDARMREFGKALDRYAAGYCDKFVTQRECVENRAKVLALYAAALKSQADATDAARKATESAAITAWRWGMENHMKNGEHDKREIGSAIARAIRDVPTELDRTRAAVLSLYAALQSQADATDAAQVYEALGFAFSYACNLMDLKIDPRTHEIPKLMAAWKAARGAK